MLRRFTLLALVSSCTAFGVGVILRDDEPVDPTKLDFRHLDYAVIANRTRNIDARIRSYRAFVEARSAIVRHLARGKLTFIDACNRLREAASTDYPWYLDYAHYNARSMQEWLAKALLWQIELEIDGPAAAAICRRLEDEMAGQSFQVWCREPLRAVTRLETR